MNQKQWILEIPKSVWEEHIKDYWCSGFEYGKYRLETFPLTGRFPEKSLGVKVGMMLSLRPPALLEEYLLSDLGSRLP